MSCSKWTVFSRPCKMTLRYWSEPGRPTQVTHKTHIRGLSTPADLIGLKLAESTIHYTTKDSILYALGVGMTVEHKHYLKYLHESHPGFSVLPTFGCTAVNPMIMDIVRVGTFPLPVPVEKLLHAEHYVEVKQPLSPSGVLINKPYVIDVLDKGKGTIIAVGVDTFDADGRHVLYNEVTVYTTHYRGWGEKRQSDKLIKNLPTPDRSPDATVEQRTSTSQAALYRLTGDENPFHIDPNMAKSAGLERPLLHGLCSFGFSCRHVLERNCDNNPVKFKSAKVRFSHPVLPGQTLQTNMWEEGTIIHFQTKVTETGETCMSGAHVELNK